MGRSGEEWGGVGRSGEEWGTGGLGRTRELQTYLQVYTIAAVTGQFECFTVSEPFTIVLYVHLSNG